MVLSHLGQDLGGNVLEFSIPTKFHQRVLLRQLVKLQLIYWGSTHAHHRVFEAEVSRQSIRRVLQAWRCLLQFQSSLWITGPLCHRRPRFRRQLLLWRRKWGTSRRERLVIILILWAEQHEDMPAFVLKFYCPFFQGKLDSYRDILRGGKALNEDQQSAVDKYDEVKPPDILFLRLKACLLLSPSRHAKCNI